MTRALFECICLWACIAGWIYLPWILKGVQ